MNSKNTNIDYTLLFIILLLGIVSCFTIYTIQPSLPAKFDGSHFFFKQILWYVLGSILIVVSMLLDYDRLRQIVWFLYGAGVLALLMLFANFPSPIIKTANGATSWFIFPGLGTIQPAEFMKIILVITIAHVIFSHNEKHENRTNKTDLLLLVKIIALALPPMFLVAVQPDLGGFLVLSALTSCLILVSGIRWRVLLSIAGLVFVIIGLVVTFYFMLPEQTSAFIEVAGFEHVESRFKGWIFPEEYHSSYGLQLINAMLATGSGQLLGKGILDLEIYIPERHTDMIFTAIAEQFGFLGASIVVTLFFLLIYRLIQIAMESNDKFGSYLVTGFIGMFVYQIFQNIGMSLQLLPITGLPLPFISYGGSSTLAYMLAIGIVLNVHSRTKVFMFDS